MQLKLRRTEETSGLFKKKTEYHVIAELVCSEEEAEIINNGLKLGDHTVGSYEHNGIEWSRKISSLINKECTFPTGALAVASEVEEEIASSAKALAGAVREFAENGDSVETEQTIDL